MKATHGRIWLAASTDVSRPVLTHVFFDAEKATLTATNSYIAARVPCAVETGDESGLIPAAAVKAAKGESLGVTGGRATLRLPSGEERSWPLFNALFPNMDALCPEPAESPFGINTDLLAAVAEALGAGKTTARPLVMHPGSPIKAIRVAPRLDDTDGYGIIMPVRIGDHTLKAPDPTVDLALDAAVIAGVAAFQATVAKRRGRPKAAQAFRDAALQATIDAAIGAAE